MDNITRNTLITKYKGERGYWQFSMELDEYGLKKKRFISIEPIQRATQKINRNDACPCESGKKYKKCCM